MKKRNVKRIISSIISLVMVLSLCSASMVVYAEDNVDWNDVAKYYPFSSWAKNLGIKYNIIFLENNSRQTTRYEVANIIYNIINKRNINQSDIIFTDLEKLNSTEKKVVNVVAANGIISGYTDNTFRPFNSVTRAEFASILARTNILDNKKEVANARFDDIQKHWAKESIMKIANLGIVSGRSNQLFCPEDTITPQEILVILDKMVSLGIIDNNKLKSVMINTFKCKEYGEKEKFIVEEIYGNYDKIQNNVIYTWPYTEWYEPANGIELATYNDLQYAIFFSSSQATFVKKEGIEKEHYDNIVKSIYASKGLEPNNEINGNKNFTLKDFLIALKHSDDARVQYLYKAVADFMGSPDLVDYYIEEDNNSNMLDAPVTKCMLNLFILKIREFVNWSSPKLGNEKLEFETDPSKVPSNYYEYPFIVKGIPKEVYEKPTVYNGRDGYNSNAKDCFIWQFGEESGKIANKVTEYYNALVNVDYANTDFENFKRTLRANSYSVSEREIDQYIEYVKENKIVLKGNAKAIPGTIIIMHPLSYIRVVLDFEIVSAKENKNIFFLDLLNERGKDIIYENNKYSLIVDVQIAGAVIYNQNGKLDFGYYAAMRDFLYQCLYPSSSECIMR